MVSIAAENLILSLMVCFFLSFGDIFVSKEFCDE